MSKKIDTELINPVDEPDSERIHRVARAATSAIPYGGGPLVELFNALIEPPMARRKKDWIFKCLKP